MTQAAGMTEPREDDVHEKQEHENNLHPGQHDEGGHGGMATREQDAQQEGDEPADD